ncbi:hypothetical protein WN51_06177 [Melipona quadrifasciata]|uniref:Uncharacterized protein n=1 Tax=Melipona quadrifasciata TaxID=166423 RepID=A0A0M8ZTC0_9HYME|nr:hypothetical protein WN51_06177 [Melipona quadrifasciata]
MKKTFQCTCVRTVTPGPFSETNRTGVQVVRSSLGSLPLSKHGAERRWVESKQTLTKLKLFVTKVDRRVFQVVVSFWSAREDVQLLQLAVAHTLCLTSIMSCIKYVVESPSNALEIFVLRTFTHSELYPNISRLRTWAKLDKQFQDLIGLRAGEFLKCSTETLKAYPEFKCREQAECCVGEAAGEACWEPCYCVLLQDEQTLTAYRSEDMAVRPFLRTKKNESCRMDGLKKPILTATGLDPEGKIAEWPLKLKLCYDKYTKFILRIKVQYNCVINAAVARNRGRDGFLLIMVIAEEFKLTIVRCLKLKKMNEVLQMHTEQLWTENKQLGVKRDDRKPECLSFIPVSALLASRGCNLASRCQLRVNNLGDAMFVELPRVRLDGGARAFRQHWGYESRPLAPPPPLIEEDEAAIEPETVSLREANTASPIDTEMLASRSGEAMQLKSTAVFVVH